MMNLLKRKTQPAKTTNEVIQEIHDTFYSEVDRLLIAAGLEKNLDTDKQWLIEKCQRLKTLGFSNTIEVKEAEKEIARLDALKEENKKNKTLYKAINYFSFKYPNYKFITEDSVKKICEKYGLVYGTVDRYTGTVPNSNLKHIESFKIDENDECWEEETIWATIDRSRDIKFVSKKHADANANNASCNTPYCYIRYRKSHLEIAAPLSDFNMDKHEVKNFKISKIEIPDPVVLKPVFYEDEKHYLIVTAWGLEASDELVVNQKLN